MYNHITMLACIQPLIYAGKAALYADVKSLARLAIGSLLLLRRPVVWARVGEG